LAVRREPLLQKTGASLPFPAVSSLIGKKNCLHRIFPFCG